MSTATSEQIEAVEQSARELAAEAGKWKRYFYWQARILGILLLGLAMLNALAVGLMEFSGLADEQKFWLSLGAIVFSALVAFTAGLDRYLNSSGKSEVNRKAEHVAFSIIRDIKYKKGGSGPVSVDLADSWNNSLKTGWGIIFGESTSIEEVRDSSVPKADATSSI